MYIQINPPGASAKGSNESLESMKIEEVENKSSNKFTPEELEHINLALSTQKKQLESKLLDLESGSPSAIKEFEEYFGKVEGVLQNFENANRRKEIADRIRSMIELNNKISEGNVEDYFRKTDGEHYAHVFPFDPRNVIYLGEKFWKASATGKNNIGGILSHETLN